MIRYFLVLISSNLVDPDSLQRVINFDFLFQSLTRGNIMYSMENLAIDNAQMKVD